MLGAKVPEHPVRQSGVIVRAARGRMTRAGVLAAGELEHPAEDVADLAAADMTSASSGPLTGSGEQGKGLVGGRQIRPEQSLFASDLV